MCAFAIETNELTKIYGSIMPGCKHRALDRLTMGVPHGEVFGFLGPNGAGKTTTLKILLGLSEPTSGAGTILGEELGCQGVHQYIGYLAENPSFYKYLSATEYLNYCGKFFHLDRTERRKRVDELVEYVGLADGGSEKLSSFSKGMLQRVGLAQALINDPDLLLLDEPMSGLDPIGRKHFKGLIRRACEEEGKTVFFCSHVLAEVEQVCDRVAILSDGHLLTQDRIENLLYLDESVYVLDCTDERFISILRGEGCAVETQAETTKVSVAGEEKAERLEKLVEEQGARIISKQVKSESLEEFFVRSVTEFQGEVQDA